MDYLKSDPKEKDPKYKDIIEKAKAEAVEIVNKECPEENFGKCRAIWETQKEILKEKYNIDWKSPAELNPYARFD
jgi:hypothetical protein